MSGSTEEVTAAAMPSTSPRVDAGLFLHAWRARTAPWTSLPKRKERIRACAHFGNLWQTIVSCSCVLLADLWRCACGCGGVRGSLARPVRRRLAYVRRRLARVRRRWQHCETAASPNPSLFLHLAHILVRYLVHPAQGRELKDDRGGSWVGG